LSAKFNLKCARNYFNSESDRIALPETDQAISVCLIRSCKLWSL